MTFVFDAPMVLAVSALVAAIGTAIATVMSARATGQKLADTGRKMDDVAATTKTIEGHVNSAATKAAMEIAALRKELQSALELAAQNKEIAALLAQSVALKTAGVHARSTDTADVLQEARDARAEAAVKDAAAGVSLKKIETHTRETAENTTRTEAKVDELKDKP